MGGHLVKLSAHPLLYNLIKNVDLFQLIIKKGKRKCIVCKSYLLFGYCCYCHQKHRLQEARTLRTICQ